MKNTTRRAVCIAAALSSSLIAGLSFGVASAEPKLVKAVAPEYPRAAQRRDLEGSVRLLINVDDSGKVIGAEVIEATPAGVFDKAALDAVNQWSFAPGASGSVEKSLNFTLVEG